MVLNKPRHILLSLELNSVCTVHHLLLNLEYRIPLPNSLLRVHIGVVKADISIFIGLDVPDKERLLADIIPNKLLYEEYGWELPVKRKTAICSLTGIFTQFIYQTLTASFTLTLLPLKFIEII